MSRVLLDTNVVLRLLARNDSQHSAAKRAVKAAVVEGAELCLAPQVIVECWVVLTRPVEVNGLGWDVEQAREGLGDVMDRFRLLPETPEVFATWWTMTESGVRGKRTHDARLVAWMRVNEVERVLTFNVRDFQGFDDVDAVSPNETIAAPDPREE